MGCPSNSYYRMRYEADKFVTHAFKRDEKESLKNVENRLKRATHDSEYYFNCGSAATSIVIGGFQ